MPPTVLRLLAVFLLSTGLAGTAAAHGAASSPWAQARASIQERLARVRTDLFSRTDRMEESVKELKAILAEDPGSAEAHLLLGVAYRGIGSPELVGEAVAELRQALTLDPRFLPARLYLAHIYLDLGRAARAREELEAGLKAAPGAPQFVALLGEAERQLGNHARAAELARQALKADPSLAQARYYLGLALLSLGRRDEAIAELERVVQSGPNQVDPYVTLGAAYLEAARLEPALAVLGRGAAIDANRPDLCVQLARAYRLKGMLAEADAQLTRAAARTLDSIASPFAQSQEIEQELYLEQGLLRLQQGRLAPAAEAFEKVLQMDPTHALAIKSLADVRRRQGAKSGAGK
jgi:tetratricopeptide (TPR) repeat protein